MQLAEAQNAVFAAIRNQFFTAGLDDQFAGPYRDIAPDPVSAPLPYVVVTFESDGRIESTSEGVICEVMARIKAIDRTLALVDAHRVTLSADGAYNDNSPPALTAGTLMLYRVQDGISMEEDDRRMAQGYIELRIVFWVPKG
jgi:hypothetical protein